MRSSMLVLLADIKDLSDLCEHFFILIPNKCNFFCFFFVILLKHLDNVAKYDLLIKP